MSVELKETVKTAPDEIPNISNQYFGEFKKENGYFRLDEEFIRKYEGKKPNFGFNGLGEFVFYRTYSRIKLDGLKETFLDMLKRVIEGCYDIQRRHCRRLHIPWDYDKAQSSAQEMFTRMWEFKFLPPGRGMWMMGTEFMWERGSAALNNCFDGDTKYITRDGIKTLKETVGSTQKVLSTGGKWVDAKIKSFGEQELLKLTLHRGRHTKTIYTTASHRWLVKSKSRALAIANGVEDLEKKPTYKIRETTTDGLKPGMRLAANFGSGINNNLRPSIIGIMHGICVGDGTTGSDNPNHGTYLYLCGEKDKQLLKYFQEFHVTDAPERGESGAKRVADLPRFFRQMPNLSEASTYLYGWLAGYFAADGRVSQSGSVQISSKERVNLEVVRSVCAILGIGTHEITSGLQTIVKDGITKKFMQHRITLFADHLRDDFFLIDEHQNRFKEIRQSGRRKIPQYCYWVVDSVETTGRRDQVYCAQVPDYHTFTLDGNILTGNCGFVSTDDMIEADPAEPFCFLMDMSMLGVGVGFDTKGAGKIKVRQPADKELIYTIHDSREGWVDSVRVLIRSFTTKAEKGHVVFNYDEIREPGSDIKGFGGKASGPGILQELHELIRDHFTKRIGNTLGSVDITDLMNYIGRCVVAGNVRRCLPKGTLVHLKRGLVPIEKVQIGDLVLTSDGYFPVTENVRQGVQKVLTIKTQMGQFRCTSRHRIAVMTDLGEYTWKRARELSVGDRMVFVDEIIPGTNTTLPGYSDLSTRCTRIAIPGLTAEVAWFLGCLHGDGYVYPGRTYKGRKYHGASVMIPINRDEYHDEIEKKVVDGLSAFGSFTIGEQPSQDNCHRIRVISKQLAHYFFKNFKKARQPLNVPECVLLGTATTRAAYVAGLLDSDGSTKNRPTTLISSVYNDFLRQVQAVYSSLGIPTKLKLRKEADDGGQAKWELSLVGDFAISKFQELVQPHAVKQLPAHNHASSNDFGYPSEWITREKVDYGRSWSPQSSQMTHQRALLCEAKVGNIVPVEIESVVDEGIEYETYDLSVPDRSEFVAQGMLVHNTAEIAFGEADDPDYCKMKNPIASLDPKSLGVWYDVTGKLYAEERYEAILEDFMKDGELQIPAEELEPAIETWNALNHHRWASNNSIFARIGMDYTHVGQQIAANGEPGLMWLDNMRDYGRMIDGRQPGIDGRVKGGNPCFAGSMRLFTEQGYVSLYDLWLADGAKEYQGTDDSLAKYGSQKIVNSNGLVTASGIYRTGIRVPVYRVKFSDNSWIDATANHTMITLVRHASKKKGKTRYEEIRKNLSDLQIGDLVPLNQKVHFGEFHDPAYAELAGWCIGDGSLSPKKDGQIRAECTCYEKDAITVLPKIQGLLHELYATHNRSSNQKPAYAGWVRDQAHFEHHEERVGSNVLGRLLKADGVRPGDKHNIPASIWRGTRETVAAFLRGFASADGFILLNENKGTISVRIKQSNAQLLRDCRLLLNQFGIAGSVHRRHGASKQLLNDGKGGKKLYKKREGYELVISGIRQVTKFLDHIGFIQDSKMAGARRWLANHFGSRNSETGRYVRVTSVEYFGEKDTYCLTEPNDNRVVIEGYQVGQCLEQSLESYELCVSGDTPIQLRDGIAKICDVVDEKVEIWNGDDWSQVVPRITGTNRKLYRVHLSDGSYLDTTANHGWSVKPSGKRVFRRVETKDLRPGSKILGFSLGEINGKYEQHAFEMGYVAGDGFLDLIDRPRYTRAMAVACGDQEQRDALNLSGRQYKPQIKEGYSDEYTRYNLQDLMTTEQVLELRSKGSPIPQWVFEFDKESVLQFVAGWIESDGSLVRQPNTDGYRIYGTEEHMRSMQLLLRRVGINHASVNFCHPKGQVTNKGVRKYDLWYVQIPSFEAGEIPTRYKVAVKIGSRVRPNPRYPNKAIDMAKKQKVVRVEELHGLHTTYCFDEPDNHMGVFGNSLTYQCNLVETFPANHEDADDYMRTLKFAYLYAKTVTLLPTHNPRTNQVTLRNRRIGLSQSGIIQAFAKFGRRHVLSDFCDAGYNEIRRWDEVYAEWLCVQKSIKVTSVKPSGCRPWHALTTTSHGILSLEELFELSNHRVDEEWSTFENDISAIQDSDFGMQYYENPIDEYEGQLVTKTTGDKLTKTYDNGISDTIVVKLSHNIELESTPNHRWFVSHTYSRNRKYRLVEFNDWKRADELTNEDVVQINPGIYSSYEHSILKSLQARHVVMRGGGSYNILQPSMMNPDLAWLLGYMWGDGSQSFSKFRMRYSDENLFNLHKAQRIILDQFGVKTSVYPASQGRKQYVLEVGSKQLWHWLLLNECLKIKSNADLIPKCVRSSTHEDIIAFIAGLCDSDGCIGRRPNDQYAIITMAGKSFAKHVQDVALAVGIVFSRSHNTRGENLQKTKSMWSLSSMQTTISDRFAYFKANCNKVIEHGCDKPWSHETGRISRILGKVVSIKQGKRQRTYDVEVANSHWYYAGAVKSHNTVSLVAGATPGIHHPEASTYWRRVRIAKGSVLVDILRAAGVHIEPASSDPHRTVVAKFAISDERVRPVEEVSIWEQMQNVVDYQRYWADNQVSCTVKFQQDERPDISRVLEAYEDQLKGISFLPHSGHGFDQAPYEPCTPEEAAEYNKNTKEADYSSYITEAVGSHYCDSDKCVIV